MDEYVVRNPRKSKFPNFLEDAGMNELRRQMGAPLVAFPGANITSGKAKKVGEIADIPLHERDRELASDELGGSG